MKPTFPDPRNPEAAGIDCVGRARELGPALPRLEPQSTMSTF